MKRLLLETYVGLWWLQGSDRLKRLGCGSVEGCNERGVRERGERLPLAHKDPFDRMLIAQAQVEGLILVTHNEAILSSGVRCLDPIGTP